MENTTIKTVRKIRNLTIGISTSAVITAIVLTILFILTFVPAGSQSVDGLISLYEHSTETITDGGVVAIAASIAAISFIGAGLGQGFATGKACEAVGRNPEAEGKIRNMMFIGCAVTESAALYGLIIAIMCLFVA